MSEANYVSAPIPITDEMRSHWDNINNCVNALTKTMPIPVNMQLQADYPVVEILHLIRFGRNREEQLLIDKMIKIANSADEELRRAKYQVDMSREQASMMMQKAKE